MSMKINRIFVLGLCLMAMSMGLAIENLPKIEIEGKTYYYYDVKKDDSLYGIAKQFGWDMQTIIAANPNSSTNLKKGQRIYYPIADQMQSEKTVTKEQSLGEVSHKVKHGETVYSISMMYGLKPEDIYELNPSSRYGIKAGEQLVVQKAVTISNDSDDVSNVYYTVQSEDSLLGVAESYDTSVEDILRLNPGLSENSFNEGDIVKLQPNSDKNETEVRNIEKRQVEHFEPYQINKGDTWTSISQQFNITTEELKEANDGIVELKKGRYLSIPVYEIVVSEEKYVVEDPREQTIEGRQELYDEIHNVVELEEQNQSVDLGVVLTVADNKNREAEFLRGLLIAVDDLKEKDYKINLHVYDATSTETPIDSILNKAEVGEFDMLITTYEKNFPKNVADFGQDKNIDIINVFDVKCNLFNTHSNFVQLLPPTSYFNDAVFNYVKENKADCKYVFVGKSNPKDTDALDNMIKEYLKINDIDYVEVEHIEQLEALKFVDDTEYLICPQLTKKSDIDMFLSMMSNIYETNDRLKFSVLARPNWIVYADQFKDKYNLFNTYIPSRFYFEQADYQAEVFIKKFAEKYGEQPVNSNPNYAALGYDVVRFFIESENYNNGDSNNGFINYNALQTDFHLSRMSNWSGFLNQCVYLINYTPSETVEKITLN